MVAELGGKIDQGDHCTSPNRGSWKEEAEVGFRLGKACSLMKKILRNVVDLPVPTLVRRLRSGLEGVSLDKHDCGIQVGVLQVIRTQLLL